MDEDGAGRRGGRGAKFREKVFWFFFWFCEALTVQTRVLFNFISYCWTTKMNFFNLENGHDANLKVFLRHEVSWRVCLGAPDTPACDAPLQ